MNLKDENVETKLVRKGKSETFYTFQTYQPYSDKGRITQ